MTFRYGLSNDLMNVGMGGWFCSSLFMGGTVSKEGDLGETKRLMGALVRMKPKPHDQMKKPRVSRAKSLSKRKRKSPGKKTGQ
jgi:hypothetical protein